jgi:phosphatidylglycerophosphatase A
MAAFISTWFGAGMIAAAPGTWGSIAALPFAWFIQDAWGQSGLFAATALVFVVGWWASAVFIKADGRGDPGMIVVDEVAGQWLTLAIAAFAPPSVALYVAALVLFRFFDILKPWPIRAIERAVPGALGVMVDDIAAGLVAGLGLFFLLTNFANQLG